MPGISFITFGMIAFLVDSFKKREESYPAFFTYAIMFPKLISGPIARYSELKPALIGKKQIRENIEGGFELFALGLSYKALLADRISGLWNNIQTIGFISISSPLAWLGAIGFSLQLYFDFQGYSLMAIGLGKMLGFSFPNNFDSPYCSRSISEFYRRWHMTLGRWFKDYIYIPLGGNRHGWLKTILNLLIVWLLTGLWHGIGLNFVMWAGFLFFFIVLEKLFLKKILDKTHVFSHLYTLLLIPVSWMFFAITRVEDIWIYLSRMFAPIVNSVGINVYAQDYMKYGKIYGPFILAAIVFALPWPERMIRRFTGKWPIVLLMFILFWLSVYEISINSNNPFMYFKF
jgi:alginate O-acetyltransferase complex protein AlgI